jgi:hypothetical protein
VHAKWLEICLVRDPTSTLLQPHECVGDGLSVRPTFSFIGRCVWYFEVCSGVSCQCCTLSLACLGTWSMRSVRHAPTP